MRQDPLIHRSSFGSENLRKIKINPLQVATSVFLFIAPFLTWVTVVSVVVFRGVVLTGFAAQSTLWDVAGSNAGLPISQAVPSSAFYAALLLILGSLVVLRRTKLGLVIATLGLVLFAITSYQLFGKTQDGSTITFVSPGIGFFVASVGIVLGAVSNYFKKQPIGILLKSLRTREGLIKAGLFLSVVPLVLDGLNHGALGQLTAFLGRNFTEKGLHVGFFVSLASILALVTLRKSFDFTFYVPRLVIIAFLFLTLDAVYHALLGGGIQNFIGHNSVEILLHISTYYGVALIVIGRLVLKR
jgi:hypothetical protein